jgi:zinc protease
MKTVVHMQSLQRIITVIATVFLVSMLVGCAASNDYRSGPPPLENVANFSPGDVDVWKLPNGLTVYFKEDRELPIVNGTLFVPGGTYWQRSDELGSVNALGSQLRAGGAGDLAPLELDRTLLERAAAIQSSFSKEYGQVSFGCLAVDVAEIMRLTQLVTLSPRFDPSRLELWRAQQLEQIHRRKEDPSTITFTAILPVLYEDLPYGQVSTSPDIRKVTREKLFELHRRFFNPHSARFVITGALSRTEAATLVEQYFGKWSNNISEPLPPLPEVTKEPTPRIIFVEAPFAQATVVVAELGVKRLVPDQIALEVFSSIFGGSDFSSRLFKRVRTELGLAYAVQGDATFDVIRGINYAYLQTKLDSTGPAIAGVLDILKGLQSEDVTAEELETVKQAAINTYVFKFSSSAAVTTRRALFDLLGYPSDYDERYLPAVKKVDFAAVRTVANRHWHADRMVIVVVGGKASIESIEAQMKSGGILSQPIVRAQFDEKLQVPAGL